MHNFGLENLGWGLDFFFFLVLLSLPLILKYLLI